MWSCPRCHRKRYSLLSGSPYEGMKYSGRMKRRWRKQVRIPASKRRKADA
jgi:hypothetical protein